MFAIVLALMALADDFDRLEGPILAGIPQSADARPRDSLTTDDLGTLPNVLQGVRTALVVVKTDDGNIARLLAVPAFRNQPGGQGEPLPILVIERFDTFETAPDAKKLARGRDLTLFDGYRLDLDSGQIVPDGQGGDLQFVAGGEAGPRLVPIAPSRMFTLTKNPLPTATAAPGPSLGRVVVPGDAAGRYRLFSNGQGSGVLELKLEEGNTLSGRLRSDQTGSLYKVSGEVGPDPPHRVRFRVDLPRAVQEFDGFLFVEGKGAIAGSFVLLDRSFGFFALREGGNVAPGDAIEPHPATEGAKRLVVQLGAAEPWLLDGKPVDEAGLTAAAKAALGADPATIAIIQAAADTPYHRVAKVAEVLRNAGAASIRFEPAAR